jgi:hypothetical protein
MRAVKGVQRATLESDSAYLDIVPLLPGGNPPIKDIREIEPSSRPDVLPLLASALLSAALLAGYIRRHRKKAPVRLSPPAAPVVPSPPPSAYTVAVEELGKIERERWPARGEVARHYESIVEVVRRYLEAAEGVPARELTTGELLWSLPPHLTEEGLRDRFGELLEEADLVKFARLRPSPVTAGQFLRRCRALLTEWQEARTTTIADALR